MREMSVIMNWKIPAEDAGDDAEALDARSDHLLSVKSASKLRKAFQFIGGLNPVADGEYEWSLESAGKLLGEACALDESARSLSMLGNMTTAAALDRVGVVLTAAGLFETVYESLPEWQQRVKRWLDEEAIDSEKERLTLGAADFFATSATGENLPYAAGAPAQNWALELTWGSSDFGVARNTALGGSDEWLSAAPAFDMSYTLGKHYVAAHIAAKGDAQSALRKYSEVFGDGADDKSEVAFNVAANSARASWPIGMDEMSPAPIARRIALKLRYDMIEASFEEQKKLFTRRPQGLMALCAQLSTGLTGARPAEIPAHEGLSRARNKAIAHSLSL